MSLSPLINNLVTAVNSALTAKGTPAMYPPDLEYIMLQVLTELSTDALVDATAQGVFTAQIALATADPSP